MRNFWRPNRPTCYPQCYDKFNRFWCSLQQVECFLNTVCHIQHSKKIVNWFRKF